MRLMNEGSRFASRRCGNTSECRAFAQRRWKWAAACVVWALSPFWTGAIGVDAGLVVAQPVDIRPDALRSGRAGSARQPSAPRVRRSGASLAPAAPVTPAELEFASPEVQRKIEQLLAAEKLRHSAREDRPAQERPERVRPLQNRAGSGSPAPWSAPQGGLPAGLKIAPNGGGEEKPVAGGPGREAVARAVRGVRPEAAPKEKADAAADTPDSPAKSCPVPKEMVERVEALVRKFCLANVDIIAQTQRARQERALRELEKQVEARVAVLEERIKEYRALQASGDKRRDAAALRIIRIFSDMKPDAAASQIASMNPQTAVAILGGMQSARASLILNEMAPRQAAELAQVMLSARTGGAAPAAGAQ